jgi:hypothetical protein
VGDRAKGAELFDARYEPCQTIVVGDIEQEGLHVGIPRPGYYLCRLGEQFLSPVDEHHYIDRAGKLLAARQTHHHSEDQMRLIER